MSNVYHARFISEDTNPWDGNESYGVWRHLEDAQDCAFSAFTADPGNVISWVETVHGTYGGLDPAMRTWMRVEHPEGEEPEDDEGGYGMYIFEEQLR